MKAPHSTLPFHAQDEQLHQIAAWSAVLSFLAAEKEQQAVQAATHKHSSQAPGSRWRQAAIKEGITARKAPLQPSPGGWNLWKAATYAFLTAVLVAQTAHARQDAQYVLAPVLQDTGNISTESNVESSRKRDALGQGGDRRLTVALAPPRPFGGNNNGRTLMRIGVVIGGTSAAVDVPDGAQVYSLRTGDAVATLSSQSRWSISASSQAISFEGRRPRDLATLPIAERSLRNVAFVPSIPPLRHNFALPSIALPFNKRSAATSAPATEDESGQSFTASVLGSSSDQPTEQSGESGYVIAPNGEDPGEHLVSVNGRTYRGCLWLRPAVSGGNATISVINVLDLEDYLLSVVPSEMPSTWPSESLKAQAIAARSYAVANIGKHEKDGYDVKATVEDQVYLGISSEHDSTNQAVAQTAGLVLKQGGKPVCAFFHSSSGGCTEVAEHVMGRTVPFLRSVPDYDDASPHFSWTRSVAIDELEKPFTKEIGQLLSFIVVSRTPSNRVKETLLIGSQGTRFVTGDLLRSTLHLPSCNFNVCANESGYSFAGRGFGHGMGMSQWGARALADSGYNAAQILAYYYKDVSVEYMAGIPGI